MKALITVLMLAICLSRLEAAEPAILYARVLQNLTAEMTDGSVWQIGKGDCFPVIAYRDSHTKLILRLANAQFVVPGDSAVVVSQKETPAAIESYKVSVNSYINGAAMRWRVRAEAGKPQ